VNKILWDPETSHMRPNYDVRRRLLPIAPRDTAIDVVMLLTSEGILLHTGSTNRLCVTRDQEAVQLALCNEVD